MKYSFVPLCLLLSFTVSALPGEQTGPTQYPDAKVAAAWPGKGPIRLFGWMPDHRQQFWKQRHADQNKRVFVGDSIVENWKLDKFFAGKPVVNRGIGGDVSRGVLFRFQEDVLDLHPNAKAYEKLTEILTKVMTDLRLL